MDRYLLLTPPSIGTFFITIIIIILSSPPPLFLSRHFPFPSSQSLPFSFFPFLFLFPFFSSFSLSLIPPFSFQKELCLSLNVFTLRFLLSLFHLCIHHGPGISSPSPPINIRSFLGLVIGLHDAHTFFHMHLFPVMLNLFIISSLFPDPASITYMLTWSLMLLEHEYLKAMMSCSPQIPQG